MTQVTGLSLKNTSDDRKKKRRRESTWRRTKEVKGRLFKPFQEIVQESHFLKIKQSHNQGTDTFEKYESWLVEDGPIGR